MDPAGRVNPHLMSCECVCVHRVGAGERPSRGLPTRPLLPGPAELTRAPACVPSLSRHSGGDAGQWSPPPAPPTALGACGHLPLGVAEMMRAAWPASPAPPAHQSVRIVPKTDPTPAGVPRGRAARQGGGRRRPRGGAENKDKGPALRPRRRLFDTHTPPHSHTQRYIKAQVSIQAASTFFTAEPGDSPEWRPPPRDLGATWSLLGLQPRCVSALPLAPTPGSAQPSGFPSRSQKGSGHRSCALGGTLELPGTEEAGVGGAPRNSVSCVDNTQDEALAAWNPVPRVKARRWRAQVPPSAWPVHS